MPRHHLRLGEMSGLTPLAATTSTRTPQQAYQRLREDHGPVAPVELAPGVNVWLVMGHREVLTVARTDRTYSADPTHWRLLHEGAVTAESGLGTVMGAQAAARFTDGDRHRRLRTAVTDSLAHLGSARVKRHLRQHCTTLLRSIAERGRADLVPDYAAHVPMLLLGTALGIPVEQQPALQLALTASWGTGPTAHAGHQHAQLLLDSIDVNSALRENLRNHTEVLHTTLMLTHLGRESITTWIAQTLWSILADASLVRRLRSYESTIEDVLAEILWRHPPIANMPARYALAETELGGQPVAAGDALILGIAAANTDPGVCPAELRAATNESHLSFGAGVHTCPADDLAWLAARIAVETALPTLHSMQLDVDPDEIPLRVSPWTRSPAALPVRLDNP